MRLKNRVREGREHHKCQASSPAAASDVSSLVLLVSLKRCSQIATDMRHSVVLVHTKTASVSTVVFSLRKLVFAHR